ncbi:hypothetical protein [Chryseobacterium culicis]|uniref:Response regulatory domain-containing protein n=1 Tax=Chryseobacterium culicis TaxID=680127 RepID=A0A1H6H073_CHRCI|nr:hypothetical protein [Chryseobacterium culicis]SEH27473.1 hypothetical protein SAMN05421593_0322 [Chryseobacterium culicis]
MSKILYIDEETLEIENFEDYIEKFDVNQIFELLTMKPLPHIDDTIDEIFKINPDAIVSDYLINENIGELGYNVNYNGVDLVEKFLKIRPKFPCFVLTAKDGDAVKVIHDVNLIYGKNLMISDQEKNDQNAKFTDRLLQQVEHYKHLLEKSSKEFDRLIELKNKGEINSEEEEILNELDEFLEKSIDSRVKTPKELMEFSNMQKLDELLDQVDLVLKKL